jgi:hypothetical protein
MNRTRGKSRLTRDYFLGVLDEDAGDTLVNVNLMDDERVEKNLKNLREIKAGGYNPYDEEIDPVTGDLARKGSRPLFFNDFFISFFIL